MNAQEKAIETIKIKGVLELLIEKYGFERIETVLKKFRI